MATADFDFSELDKWADDLGHARTVTRAQARGVVSKGALDIKNESRQNAPRGPHVPYYAASIAYDVNVVPQGFEAEIGPTPGRRQWGLGNLLEYGSAHNPPHPHHEPALDHEEPKFLEAAEHLAAGDRWINGGWAAVPGVTL